MPSPVTLKNASDSLQLSSVSHKTKQTFKWALTCANHTGKPVEIADAGKWDEGGENISRTGGFSILQIQM